MESGGPGAAGSHNGAGGPTNGASNGAHGPAGFGASRAPGRPVRKDEIVIEERGLYVESWLPERRSRRRPLLLLHGELGGSWLWERYLLYFAQRGWEGHALNLRAHFWSENADFEELDISTYIDDAIAAAEALGRPAVVIGHGMGALLAMKLAEQRQVHGLVLLSPALPRPIRPGGARRTWCAWCRRGSAGSSSAGPARRTRSRGSTRTCTLKDVMRVQHLMGAESGAARRQMLEGVPVERELLNGVPTLVIGAGVDRMFPEPDSERLAEWLGAEYQPFGAHSHYGLVIGEESHEQVADAIRGVPGAPPPVVRPAAVPGPAGRGTASRRTRRRIRLEAQDTALSRRRPPVRIRYAVPTRILTWLTPSDRTGGVVVLRRGRIPRSRPWVDSRAWIHTPAAAT